MSVDLDQLLRAGGGEPGAPSDAAEIWRQGRQRRRRRLVGASVSGVAVVALLVVVPLTSGSDLRPVIDPMAQEGPAGDDAAPDEGSADVPDDRDQDTDETALSSERHAELQELTRQEAERIRQAVDDARQRMQEANEAGAGEQAETPAVEPDSALMADPCAAHQGGEMRAFIDVVSPVEGQQVSGEVELIGCASVYEATLQYRVVSADGQTLLADFTTATAGGPEIGEFRETITLPAGGQARYLEVYWEDAASGSEQHPDGPERDLVRIAIEGS